MAFAGGPTRPANSGILILPPLINKIQKKKKKKKKKRYQIWTPSGSAHEYDSEPLWPIVIIEYILSKKSNVICIVPKLLTPKRYIRAIICVFIAWQTSESHLHKGIFLFHHSGQKYHSSIDWKYIQQRKNAIRMRNNINFHFFNKKTVYTVSHLIHSFKKLKVKQFILLKLSPLQLVLHFFTSYFPAHLGECFQL